MTALRKFAAALMQKLPPEIQTILGVGHCISLQWTMAITVFGRLDVGVLDPKLVSGVFPTAERSKDFFYPFRNICSLRSKSLCKRMRSAEIVSFKE